MFSASSKLATVHVDPPSAIASIVRAYVNAGYVYVAACVRSLHSPLQRLAGSVGKMAAALTSIVFDRSYTGRDVLSVTRESSYRPAGATQRTRPTCVQ